MNECGRCVVDLTKLKFITGDLDQHETSSENRWWGQNTDLRQAVHSSLKTQIYELIMQGKQVEGNDPPLVTKSKLLCFWLQITRTLIETDVNSKCMYRTP